MASDTVPAVVPNPTDPPPSTAPTSPAHGGTQQQTDGLSGLLAPVAPARAAFTLDPDQTTEAAGGEQAVTDANSALITTDDNPAGAQEKDGKPTSGKQQSVIRAWMLAGAERWKKGADARNKRLDIQKEKAKARQVKETVTVNRSEKIAGGSANSSTGSKNSPGKSLNSKSNGAGKTPGTGPKNSSGPAGGGKPGSGGSGRGNSGGQKGDAGRSGSGGGSKGSHGSGGTAGGKGGGSGTANGGKDRGGAGKQPTGKSGADSGSGVKADKQKKASTGTTCGDTGGTGKSGAAGASGKPGKDGGTAKDPKPSTGPATEPGSKDKPATRTDTKPAADKNSPAKPDPKTPAKPSDATDRPDPKATDSASKTKDDTTKTGDPKTVQKQADQTTKPGEDAKADKADKSAGQRTPETRTPAPQINLQNSREAGYRDGTRAAKAAAHASAWRDGVRDGWTDTRQAADRENQRLDQAHADRKQSRTSPEDTPVTQPAFSTDYQQKVPPKPTHAPGPQPVPVTSVNDTHVHLGDGAARPHISRGEVRTLRNFQHRLQGKTDRMILVAEATQALEQHANEQAKQVTHLLEQARGVKGGEKLVAALTKLADDANVQATKAAEINKRAVRSADACKALHTNSETRYGGIYQAVVDSPENTPAVMDFYREMGHTNA